MTERKEWCDIHDFQLKADCFICAKDLRIKTLERALEKILTEATKMDVPFFRLVEIQKISGAALKELKDHE